MMAGSSGRETKKSAGGRNSIPTSLPEEVLALYSRMAAGYQGRGRVFEAGAWLGNSTRAICAGLDASGKDWSATVFDRFLWSASDAKAHPTVELAEGESTLPLVKGSLKGRLKKIEWFAGDPMDIANAVPQQGPIELAFIDGANSWRVLWRLLQHIGPSLLPDARLVIHGILGISGRQGACLLGSLPQLALVEASAEGDVAVFAVSEPLADLGGKLPSNIRDVPIESLLAAWEAVTANAPEATRSALAAGLALDLLDRSQPDQASALLERAVKASPNAPVILAALSRLLRKSGQPTRDRLLQVMAYLRLGVSPQAVARAIHRVAPPEPELATTDEGEARDAALASARVLRQPLSVAALALRHAAHHGLPEDARFRRIYSALQSAHKLGLPALAKDLAPLLPGADVLNTAADPALFGLVLRAMGAASYQGLLAEGEGERIRRSYRNPVTQLRVKSGFSPADLEGVDPGLVFRDQPREFLPQSADLLMLRPAASLVALERVVTEALRLLRPGGRLCLVWRNPRSWSGHGRAPQSEAEINPADPEQAALLDWQHLGKIGKTVPSLAELRALVASHFIIERWSEELDDPAALIRLTPRMIRSRPNLTQADLICHSIRIIARL
jgi:SAM-dependent methyltransferase